MMWRKKGERVGEAEANMNFSFLFAITYTLCTCTFEPSACVCVYIYYRYIKIVRVNEARNMIYGRQKRGLRGFMRQRDLKGSSSFCPFRFLSISRIPSLSFTLFQLRNELLRDRKILRVSRHLKKTKHVLSFHCQNCNFHEIWIEYALQVISCKRALQLVVILRKVICNKASRLRHSVVSDAATADHRARAFD